MLATNPISLSFEAKTIASEKENRVKQSIHNFVRKITKQIRKSQRYASAMFNRAEKFFLACLGSTGLSLISFYLALYVPILFLLESITWLVVLFIFFILLATFFSYLSLIYFILWIVEITKDSSSEDSSKKPSSRDLEKEKRNNRRKKKRNR